MPNEPLPIIDVDHTLKELPRLAIPVRVDDPRFVAYNTKDGAPLALLKKPRP